MMHGKKKHKITSGGITDFVLEFYFPEDITLKLGALGRKSVKSWVSLLFQMNVNTREYLKHYPGT